MRLRYTTVLPAIYVLLTCGLANPIGQPGHYNGSGNGDGNHGHSGGSAKSTAAAACPTQAGPIAAAANQCSSGAPYCCSGSGSGMVCGPSSSTSCDTTTICCINTNGMQICAGEIDFTGPVTININL